jgi:hypothetical protein
VRGKDKFIKMNSFGESLWAFWSDYQRVLGRGSLAGRAKAREQDGRGAGPGQTPGERKRQIYQDEFLW